MSHHEPLSQWIETVSTAFPQLSRPQAKVLALWSYGMVLAKACGITLVCAALALQLGCSEASLVQRLREWCYGAKDKRGWKRQELDVSTCFAPLLCWILRCWPAQEPRLALALDATTFCETFYGALYQCRLSRLRHPGGVESRRRRGKRELATALDGAAESLTRHGARRVDGYRDERSWLVCSLAVPAHRVVGVASFHAYQQARQLSSSRGGKISGTQHGSPDSGPCLVWGSGVF
jgi:hypothetical protein